MSVCVAAYRFSPEHKVSLVQLNINVSTLVDHILHPSCRAWTNQLPVVRRQLMTTWCLRICMCVCVCVSVGGGGDNIQ